MQAGRFDAYITIQQSIIVKDDYGQEVETGWSDFAPAWASTKSIGAGEGVEAQALTYRQRVSFMIRTIAGVKPDMRIKWNDQYYNIREVMPFSSTLTRIVGEYGE